MEDNKVDYDPSFALEVFRNVDYGEWIKMCMQCGVCAASCPLREHMDYPPRQIFTLIRAGRKDKVLHANSIMMCTSCYTCQVKCPRGIPVIEVMHGLAHYSISQGIMTRKDTATFGKEFWNQIYRLGRIDEKDLSRRYFFAGGIVEGIKKSLEMARMGIVMLLHGRMKLLPERKIKGIKTLRTMLDKAMQSGSGEANL